MAKTKTKKEKSPEIQEATPGQVLLGELCAIKRLLAEALNKNIELEEELHGFRVADLKRRSDNARIVPQEKFLSVGLTPDLSLSNAREGYKGKWTVAKTE